jgi:flagellar biosynthesis protein FlhF
MEAIQQDVAVRRFDPADERGYLFVGPPGIGKTTTMSKVAFALAGSGRPVSIISLDSRRISAVAYLKELSRQVRCDVKLARSVSELPKLIYKEAEKGPVLVDTPGTGLRDIMQQKEELFPRGLPLTTCLLMDAAMDQQASMRIWQQVAPYAVDAIGFTKLDLAGPYGPLYNIAVLTGKPLAFITDGPDVPQDFKIPTPEFVAGLVAGGVCEN